MPLHAAIEETETGLVVGLLLELELSAVLHVLTEFGGVAPAELLERRLNLLLLDVVVLFILRATWKSLPRELTLDEVEEYVTDSLEIVSPGLLNTLVGSNGSISGSSSEVLAVLVGDVVALGVLVALGETEIDDVNVVAGGVLTTDQEVVWLNVSVDDPLLVHFFDASDQLDGDHQDGF